MDACGVAGLLLSARPGSLALGHSVVLMRPRAKGQPPQAVAAAQGRLRRRRSSPMRPGIAFVAAPCIQPRGARHSTTRGRPAALENAGSGRRSPAHTILQQPARLRVRMGLMKEYAGKRPVLGARVYLAETAAVIGDVVLGDDVSIWFNSVVRGDCHFIRIGDRTNIQDQ